MNSSCPGVSLSFPDCFASQNKISFPCQASTSKHALVLPVSHILLSSISFSLGIWTLSSLKFHLCGVSRR